MAASLLTRSVSRYHLLFFGLKKQASSMGHRTGLLANRFARISHGVGLGFEPASPMWAMVPIGSEKVLAEAGTTMTPASRATWPRMAKRSRLPLMVSAS